MYRVQGSPQRHNQFCRRFKDPDDLFENYFLVNLFSGIEARLTQNLPRGAFFKAILIIQSKKRQKRATSGNHQLGAHWPSGIMI